MTSSHHGPYGWGYTRATMGRTEGCQVARRSKSQKPVPSSDCRLQPAGMKSESLVIADQPCRGEYVPEPCTHRPSSHETESARSRLPNRKEGGAEGEFGDWD